MHLLVRHETSYAYDAPARSVIQLLRLTPRPHEGQHIRRWRIDVDRDAILRPHEDCFGNIVHAFGAEGSFRSLTIAVEGEVQTEDTNGILRGTTERLPLGLYLRETALTAPDEAIGAFALEVTKAKPTLDTLHALNCAIHERLRFDTTATDATTTARRAFAEGHGVCQDFAHVFIAAARSLKIPSRYVSGYMRHNDGTDDYEAGHGWAEAHIPDLGWVAFDPANAVCANEAYLRVACGLDYLDASPVRGVRTGGVGETLDVRITMREAGAQQ